MNEVPGGIRRRTVRNAASSVVQLVVATLTLFVLYRVVLDILGTAQFGIWSLVVAATSVVGLSNMGLTGSLVKYVAESDAAGDTRRLAGLVETTAISVGVLSAVLAIAGLPLMNLYFGMTLSGDAYRSAEAIVPYALLSFSLSMVTGIYQSALYGCHLIVQRNAILIFESLSFLALSVVLAPRYGLPGLVYARALQNFITLALSIAVLRRHLPVLPWIPTRWDRTLFRELLGYAASFQFVGILNLLMDPLTKGMLSRFGSLELVTYFEMGTRLISQVRGAVVNANQVLVPTYAQAGTQNPGQVTALFGRSYATIFFVTICLLGLLAASLPLVGILWLGMRQPDFIAIATILSVGWLINTLSVPAYFACLGTGAMGIVVRSHVIMAVLNLVLGLAFGRLWGGYGVVVAWSLALAAGGLAAHVEFCRRSGLGWRGWFPAQGIVLLVCCVLAVAVARLTAGGMAGGTVPALAGVLAFAALFAAPALRNPARADIQRLLLRTRAP